MVVPAVSNVEMATLLDAVAEALTAAGLYNRNDQAPPAAVLWPDKERQWEPLIPLLRPRLPLLTLDHSGYAPAERRGPAYYLRCMIGRTLSDDVLPSEAVPVIYLPGVSRSDLRAVDECPRPLLPLAELQYRGVLWTHKNGRDWTITSFLQAADGGLDIEVGTDTATKEALQRALLTVANTPLAVLRRETPLRAAFFDALLTPDEARSLLQWLNDPVGYPARCTPGAWASFCDVCLRKYGFHPERDGAVSAAELLGSRDGHWQTVWRRFAEAPATYTAVPALLDRAHPKPQKGKGGSLFYNPDAWPQENNAAEQRLCTALLALRERLPGGARATIHALEEEHGPRRSWVWAALGRAPLASALASLVILAKHTERALGGATTADIVAAYADWGWQADAAAIGALAAVEDAPHVEAVAGALTAVYRPWLEAGAVALQAAVAAGDLRTTYPMVSLPAPEQGTCILFSDALRLDAGQKLAAELMGHGLSCTVTTRLAALPTVTPTAKPAVSPVAERFTGVGTSALTPVLAGTTRAVTVDVLRATLSEVGFQVLRGDETGDPSGRAWTEAGAIDSYGHQHGWKVAHHLGGEIRTLRRRVEALLAVGWQRVLVVTDHGWLMLPDGLPKVDLPESVTSLRKGRRARLKEFADAGIQTVPWFWDPSARLAVAQGIACYEAGHQYEHGGISPQECVVPVLTVTSAGSAGGRSTVSIESVKWTRLRCRVTVGGAENITGITVDLRSRAADASSSLAESAKPIGGDRTVSLAAHDDESSGETAVVVVLDAGGQVLAKQATIVGGDAS